MKVGQKYKVRSWDDMKREFGIAQTGDEIYIPCLAFFVKDMCRFCGTTITVSYILYTTMFLESKKITVDIRGLQT